MRKRFLDNNGCPVCLHCGAKTNAAYANHFDSLPCWNCGIALSYEEETAALIKTFEVIGVPPLASLDVKAIKTPIASPKDAVA